ncbi:preprotein translocase subunit SecG [Cohaesibacter sp. ES.047]|uniref:preprotein translocase subunit SecG n=1 Tax=Cohaesibacter sp. ES.047 TaxID=1798205 RepID=UPI000BB68D33|nr:preprotein translocase subunit SecG [Cohaesibacter sp. ES.047]SNY93674.1 preprotein translocase subunit SecG [Cohaesibacter sp. ES.047]
MESVVIVIHLLIVAALVVVVLLQRSEGGGLGIGGGGGGGGGFLTGRGAANLLTRTTAILAAGFFMTSLGLTILAGMKSKPSDVLDNVPAQTLPSGVDENSGGILDELQQLSPSAPTPSEAPATEPTGPQVPTSQ